MTIHFNFLFFFFDVIMFVKKKIIKCKMNITIDANFVFKKIKKISTTKMIKKFTMIIIKLNKKTMIFIFKQFINEKFIKLKKFALISYRSKKITNVHII